MADRPTEGPSNTRGRKWARLLCALIILALAGWQIGYAFNNGNDLSGVADPFSEADALRSAEGYALRGFTRDAGLPDILFGDQFPNQGSRPHRQKDSFIYTHYPPGPNWIAGVLTKVIGKGHIRVFRLFPIAIGVVSMSIFAWCLAHAMGTVKAAAMLLACAAAPMFTNMMHGLHFQGYAHSLLLVELGVLVLVFRPGRKIAAAPVVVLSIIGFLQGWLSFDYCFVITFAPVPLWILRWQDNWKMNLQRGVLCVLAVGLGFTVAHGLHFGQVAAYLGSAEAAFDDLAGSARTRAVGKTYLAVDQSRLKLLFTYLTYSVHDWKFFGWTLSLVSAFVAAMVTTHRGRLVIAEPMPLTIQWHLPRGRSFAVMLVALAVSCMWIVLMWNHAFHHHHILPRHFFLFYFCCLLVLIDGLSAMKEPQPAPTGD